MRATAAILCAIYAAIGVATAELLLQGLVLILRDEELIQFGSYLVVSFVVSALFLDPLRQRLEARIKLRPIERGRASFLFGALGAGVALFFVMIASGIEEAAHHSPLGSIFLFAVLLLVPGAVTLGWILGARQRRAALFGGLLALATDFLARLVLWLATGSAVANPNEPSGVGIALIAATAGAIQAGFYGYCGGLALDLTQGRHPIGYLASALLAAILLWSIGYHFIGGYFGLPGADAISQVIAFIIRAIDYAGWVLGLALCPYFSTALRQVNPKTSPDVAAEPRNDETRVLP